MKFYENRVGIFFHTKMLCVKDFNFHNHWTFNVSLSDERNEYFQEIASTEIWHDTIEVKLAVNVSYSIPLN